MIELKRIGAFNLSCIADVSILWTVLIIGTSRITRLVAVCRELNQTHAKCRVTLNVNPLKINELFIIINISFLRPFVKELVISMT